MKRFDICALGELLIDFTENGTSSQGNPLLEANPGGAPCNVLSMMSRQGKKTAFIGKVGNDIFGRQLKAAVEEVGINTEGLVTDEEVHTTLAFVKTLDGGDREFSFYRNPGADMMLSEADVNEKPIEDCTIFHFGSLSMTHIVCEAATKKAVATAKRCNAIISFDPNLRHFTMRHTQNFGQRNRVVHERKRPRKSGADTQKRISEYQTVARIARKRRQPCLFGKRLRIRAHCKGKNNRNNGCGRHFLRRGTYKSARTRTSCFF